MIQNLYLEPILDFDKPGQSRATDQKQLIFAQFHRLKQIQQKYLYLKNELEDFRTISAEKNAIHNSLRETEKAGNQAVKTLDRMLEGSQMTKQMLQQEYQEKQ